MSASEAPAATEIPRNSRRLTMRVRLGSRGLRVPVTILRARTPADYNKVPNVSTRGTNYGYEGRRLVTKSASSSQKRVQVVSIAATHGDFRSILKCHNVLAAKCRFDGLNAVDVDDCRSMNPAKHRRIQLTLEMSETLAQQMPFPPEYTRM